MNLYRTNRLILSRVWTVSVTGDASLEQCVHWIPGWHRCAEDPPDLFAHINAEKDAAMQERIQIIEKEHFGGDPAVAAVMATSKAEAMEDIAESHKNLTDLLVTLWNDYQIVAKGTVGDGNCGVETLMSFEENMASAGGVGKLAARKDILEIMKAYRQDLAGMWEKVSHDAFWQRIWKHFVKGRVNMKPWMDQLGPDAGEQVQTPDPKRKAEISETTPPKVMKKHKGKILGDQADEPMEMVAVAMPEDGAEATEKKKKKRTGKARDLADLITLDKYLPRFLAENGMTSRSWTAKHRETKFVSFLDRKPSTQDMGIQYED